MQLEQITPLILTFNEACNLQASLDGLSWAKQIVVVDSGSTDATLSIAKKDGRVAVYYRTFDHFANQCNFGLTKISTPWTLSLDADYVCSKLMEAELIALDPSGCAGFQASFVYCIYSRKLRASLYPPRTVLYQTQKASYRCDGHAHRVVVDGRIGKLKSKIHHDDHKPIDGWLHSQVKYETMEAEKLEAVGGTLGWKDRIRKKILFAPVLTVFYCLFGKGLAFNGWAGWYYTFQRVLAEVMLSLALLDMKLKTKPKSSHPPNPQ